MKFSKTTSRADVARTIAERLVEELSKGKSVLWLMPGGSNIAVAVEVMGQIPEELTENLTVGLTDERFGATGHADSNWRQLAEAGFQPKRAKALAVLDDSGDFTTNAANYEQKFREVLSQNDVKIGFFGMGADGHIAGILPESPAVNVSDDRLFTGYDAGNFQRMTMTFSAIKQLDDAFLAAFGEEKREALENLRDKELPLQTQPAQILNQLPDTTVFNDILA
jgi:6-phosphogluconolactonase/glucosamine-6-phosphate isomerase/deaminase